MPILPQKSMFRPKDEGFMPMCTAAALVSLTILCVAVPYLHYLGYLHNNPAEAAWTRDAVTRGDISHGPWAGRPEGDGCAMYLLALFYLPGCTALAGFLIASSILDPDVRHRIKWHWIVIVFFQFCALLFLDSQMGWLIE